MVKVNLSLIVNKFWRNKNNKLIFCRLFFNLFISQSLNTIPVTIFSTCLWLSFLKKKKNYFYLF